MMGGFITRVSVMILGYAYPAYECYKTVELNKPEIELLLFWCQYWILVAVLAVFERVGDALVSWLPLYGEVKLAFFVYLWHPKTKGTTYIYNTFFRPYMSKHENKIDRTLIELKTRAADLAVRYWQKALSNGRSRIFEILQYVVSQPSSTMVHPVEEPRHAHHVAISSPPPENDQTLTAQQQLLQNERSSTSHHPNPTPHNTEMLVHENLTATNNHNSFPHSQDTTKQEEPTRIIRRSKIKKRVTTATGTTSVH